MQVKDDVLIQEPLWLYVTTEHNTCGEQSLLVYKSPLVPDDARLLDPVRKRLLNRCYQRSATEEFRDTNMMSHRAVFIEYTIYRCCPSKINHYCGRTQ